MLGGMILQFPKGRSCDTLHMNSLSLLDAVWSKVHNGQCPIPSLFQQREGPYNEARQNCAMKRGYALPPDPCCRPLQQTQCPVFEYTSFSGRNSRGQATAQEVQLPCISTRYCAASCSKGEHGKWRRLRACNRHA